MLYVHKFKYETTIESRQFLNDVYTMCLFIFILDDPIEHDTENSTIPELSLHGSFMYPVYIAPIHGTSVYSPTRKNVHIFMVGKWIELTTSEFAIQRVKHLNHYCTAHSSYYYISVIGCIIYMNRLYKDVGVAAYRDRPQTDVRAATRSCQFSQMTFFNNNLIVFVQFIQ